MFISSDVEGQALAAMIMDALKGYLKVAAVKAPKYGEERKNTLLDLAASVGATFVSKSQGKRLRDVKLVDFGTCDRIDVTRYQTTIVGGNGDQDQIQERIELLKEDLQREANLIECEKIQDRIARLASGIAIIKVGGATEIEMVEKKHRIEDALEAVKSAQLEGIVPGGGTALMNCARNLQVQTDNKDQDLGVEIIRQAITAPLRQMAENAGLSSDIVCSQVMESEEGFGFDFVNNQVVNMMEHGIIDPVKVTKSAIQNAASVSGTLITTNYAIVEN